VGLALLMAAQAAAGPQVAAAAAPENLLCPGLPAPALPAPDWRVEPVWDWRDLGRFEGTPGDDGPYAVALDRTCNSYVADAQNFQIVKLSREGQRLAEWKLPGPRAAGEASSPRGVAVDAQGNVYATDTARNRVLKFSPQGQVIATWGECTPSAATNFCDPKQPGLFTAPEAVAVDGAGTVYVVEPPVNRIQKLRADGQPVAVWDMAGRVPGQLWILGGVALDEPGNLFVAEEFNNQVLKFDPSGALVGRWGSPEPGSGPGQFDGPRGVAVDGAGNLYVSDRDNWRVVKLGPDGALLDQWRNCLIGTVQDCQIAGAGDLPGQFFGARGLVADGQASVYVADTGNKRVERLLVVDWVLVPPPPPPPAREV
jgi:DNA-binding beta-propeller fold protein YncE